MRIISFILFIAIVLFGMMFAALNYESVTVNYYFNESTLPLCQLLVIVFALGCLVGMIVGMWLLIKAKMQNYRLHHRLSIAEKEIENLRAIPLQGTAK